MIQKRYSLSITAQIFLLITFFIGAFVAFLFISGYRLDFADSSFLSKSGFVVFSSPGAVLTKNQEALESDSVYKSFPLGKYDFCAEKFFFAPFCVQAASIRTNDFPILSMEDVMLFPEDRTSHYKVYAMENIFFDPQKRGVFWQEKQGNMLKGIDMFSGEVVFSEFFSPLKTIQLSPNGEDFIAEFMNGSHQVIQIFSPEILGLSSLFSNFPYPASVSQNILFRSPERNVPSEIFATFDLPIVSFHQVPSSDIVFVELGQQLFSIRLSVFSIFKIGNVDRQKPVLFSAKRKEILWQEKGILKGFFW